MEGSWDAGMGSVGGGLCDGEGGWGGEGVPVTIMAMLSAKAMGRSAEPTAGEEARRG